MDRTDLLLTDAIQFIVDSLRLCGIPTCKATRWHGEPDKLLCCNCDGDQPGYTVVGWIAFDYEADGALREAAYAACPVLGAVEMGFTVSRCWPITNRVYTDVSPQDDAAADLLQTLDCLKGILDRCVAVPGDFREGTIKFSHTGFRPRRNHDETPYGQEGTVTYACAGWSFGFTVAGYGPFPI